MSGDVDRTGSIDGDENGVETDTDDVHSDDLECREDGRLDETGV